MGPGAQRHRVDCRGAVGSTPTGSTNMEGTMEQMMITTDGRVEACITRKRRDDGSYKSRVFTERPPYADYDAPHKFMAIQAIIAKRIIEHPNAICSYSGGADSDIMIDLI